MMRLLSRPLCLLILLLALPLPGPVAGAAIYYTFASDADSGTEGGGGGVAVLEVDPQTAAVIRHETIFQVPAFKNPHKLAVSPDQRLIVMVNESEADNIAVLRLEGGKAIEHRVLTVKGVPDAVTIFGRHALIGADKGHVTLIDLEAMAIKKHVNTREMLNPPGHKVEDIAIAPDADYAVFSLQKDQSGHKSLGNRLVLVKLPTLQVICDLQLPRDKPQLHNPHNDKEQGPGPEVIVLRPELNRLGVSLDLYGGFALTDLDAALRGEPGEVTYLSTAPDGAWGTAFPDRLCLFPHPEAAPDQPHDLVMIFNSGEVGGGCVIDLAKREVVARFDCPPGLETPTYLPAAGLIAATHNGKVKSITPQRVDKDYEPSARVFVYDVRRLDGFNDPRIIELPEATYRLEAIDPHRSPLVAVVHGLPYVKRSAEGRDNAAQQSITLLDTSTGEIKLTFDAHGEPRRLVRR